MKPVLSDPLFQPRYGIAWWSERAGTTLVNWAASREAAQKMLDDYPEDFQYRGYLVASTVAPVEEG